MEKRKVLFQKLITIFFTVILLASVTGAQAIYVGPVPNADFKTGRVMARSIVLDPDTGEPIMLEYNQDGTEGDPVNTQGNSVFDLNIVPAADYRFYQTQLESYNSQYADTLAKDAELLTRREFEQAQFVAADGQTPITQGQLHESINSVLVRGQSNRLLPDPNQLVLLSFTLDMVQDITISDDIITLVTNQEGQIIHKSQNNIAYRTGFFGDPSESQDDYTYQVGQDDTVFGPVSGVKVNVDEFAYRGGVDVTDNEGKYSFRFYMPLCPPGGFTFTTDVWAELRYKNFLPTGSPSIPYYLKTPGYSYCYASIGPIGTLAGLSASLNAQATIATSSTYIRQSNLYADVMFVTGRIALQNVDGSDVEISDTTYTSFDEPADNKVQNYYDFNGDGRFDTVIQGNVETRTDDDGDEYDVFVASQDGDKQGIFFDGQQDDELDFPDLVRIIDQEIRNEPIGVLKSISSADLRNTDVLFFRESTGQLIMERRGLKEAESQYRSAVRYDDEENEVAYRIMLRGPRDTSLNVGGGVVRSSSYEEWATQNQLTETFQARNSDQPKSGEFIKIVAINRATGYIGTARVRLLSAGDNGTGLLDVSVPPISMRPPNLKVWAERNYEVEAGLTEGEDKTYTIGSEGAALTSDTTITIYTEWLDAFGRPLPDELGLDSGEQYGLTGRLAKVVSANSLQGVSAGSDLAEFPIAPGRKTQVINVGDNLTRAEHFYIHVIGKPKDQECVNNTSCPSFDTTGSEAPFDSRPKLLTPFLVPLPEEDNTWREYLVYKNVLDQHNANEGEQEDEPTAPLPAYSWQFRPEYQFSQYDLEVQDIKRPNEDTGFGNNDNVFDADDFVVNDTDQYLEVFYSLISNSVDSLDPIDGEQELILSLGGDEQIVTIDDDGSIKFENLDSLGQLDAEDYLNIRLYANNDAANILWEYQFETASTIGFKRTISLASFNSAETSTGTIADITDSYRQLSFNVERASIVDIEVLDEDLESLGSLVTRREYDRGSYFFIVTYEDMSSFVLDDETFYIAVNKVASDTGVKSRTIYTGKTETVVDSEVLGQVIEHDTLIQRGSLTLRREDVVLKGVGPQLNFTRSYSNATKTVNRNSPLGKGWSHNHNIYLTIVAESDSQGLYDNNLPNWIKQFRFGDRPEITPVEEFPDLVTSPRLISVSNGGMFIYKDGSWRPSRGFHGRLSVFGDRYEYISKDGTRYLFEAPTQIIQDSESSFSGAEFPVNSIIDRNDNELTYEYQHLSGRKLVSKVTDATGRFLSFNYLYLEHAGDHRLDNVSSPDTGITINFDYSAPEQEGESDPLNGALTGFSRADFTETYVYEKTDMDNIPNLTSVTDAIGNITEYDYLEPGNVPTDLLIFAKGVRYTDVVGEVTYPGTNGKGEIEYLFSDGNQRRVSDLNGNLKTYTLNTFGNPIKVEEPLGKTTEMEWTIDQGLDDVLVTSQTDALGRETTFEYDTQGNITEQTDPIGTVKQTWNQAFSVLLEREDRNGNSSNYSYDAKGNLLTETDAEGYVTTHTYASNGLRVTTRHADNGGTTTYSYDNHGNLSKTLEPEGSEAVFTNDARGNNTVQVDPNGNQTVYAYDDLDRVETVTHPDTFTTSYSYDAKGNKLSETDKLGLTLNYDYDPRDRVASVSRSFGGGGQTFTYDDNSNLLTETDWKGQTTTHTYDELNRRTKTENRIGDEMLMGYDLVNNLKSSTDYRGNSSNYDYDDGDRKIRETNALADTMVYTYDNQSNVLTHTDFEGRLTQLEYDDRYLVIQQTNALSGVSKWQYDGRKNNTQAEDEEGRIVKTTYDRQNRPITVEDAIGFVTTTEYDDNSNPVLVNDRRGFDITHTYDEINRLISTTDGDGFVMSYEYDANSNKTSHIDGNDHETTYAYDTLNRLITQISPVNGNTSHTYDANNNLLTTNDAIGTVYQNEYDELDRSIKETHAIGTPQVREQSKSYDPNGNLLSLTNFRGYTTNYQYDVLNRVTQERDALNQIITFTYDAVGNTLSNTNKRSFTTNFEYDDLNRLTTTTDALSQTIVNTYDAVGNVLSITDKRGTTTTNIYDRRNQLLTSTKPDGAGNDVRMVKNEYDGEGNTSAITDANDNRSQYVYNGRNLPIEVINPDNTRVVTTFDGAGNSLTSTDEIGQVTSFTYDDANRQITSTNFASETTTFQYDLNNNRTLVTQPLTNTMDYVFDALNRVAQITDGENNVTQYTYDKNDNQASHIDANNNQVDYEYDELDRRTRHTQPNSLVTSYSYDPENNMLGYVDANGQTFGYGYDELNRQTNQTFPSVATAYLQIQSIATNYDPNNNPLSITETKFNSQTSELLIDITARTYDLLDRETNNTQRDHSIDYQYDFNGNRTNVSSAGGSTAYSYDSRNRLISATTGNGTTTTIYTDDSKQASVTYPNGTITKYNYDNADRVQSVFNERIDTPENELISSFVYIYDDNSNRTSQVETQTGFTTQQVQSTAYTYDNTNRMTGYSITDSDSGNVQTLSYTFDGNYNRISEIETLTNGATTTTIKDRTSSFDANNRLSLIIDNLLSDTTPDNDSIDYIYDNNGNTLSKTDKTDAVADVTNFEYDSRNQLIQVIRGPPTAQVNQGFYDYNYNGYRVRHLASERGDIDYIYDGQSILEERTLNTEQLLAHYRYSDRLISLNTDSDEQYYHYSALRTTANLTNSSGATQTSYRTDIWGHITDQVGTSPNRQVFTGQEHDEKTGLIYFGARFYDPDTARFINQDSYLGESLTPPSLHRYLYAYGNPGVYVDLDGYETVKEMMGLDDKSVDADMAAGKTGVTDALAYAGKTAVYKTWNFVTGGFLERQDDRRHKYDRGQISDSEFNGGTFSDMGISVVATFAGGAVGSKVATGLGAGTAAKFAGAAAGSAFDDATNQAGQVLTHQATDGRLGQEKMSATNVLVAATVGTVMHGVSLKVTPKRTVEATPGPIAKAGDARASMSARADAEAGMPFNHPVKAPSIKTWNQFQSSTKGQFSSRREAGDAWSSYKERNGLSSTNSVSSRGAIKGLPKLGSLSNEATRKWYFQQLDAIPSQINSSLPLRERALQAFKLRNDVKLQARTFMSDRAAAAGLPAPKTLQDVVGNAYGQGLRGDGIWRYVLGGSQRSNAGVDAALGLTR